jgi:hypothetical protein
MIYERQTREKKKKDLTSNNIIWFERYGSFKYNLLESERKRQFKN